MEAILGKKFKTIEFGTDIWGDKTMVDKWWEVKEFSADNVIASLVYSNEKLSNLNEIKIFKRIDLVII